MYKLDGTGGPRGQLAGDHKIAEYIVEHAFNDLNQDDPTTIHYVRKICEQFQGINLKNGYLEVNGVVASELDQLRSMMGTIELLVSKNLPVSGYIPGDGGLNDIDRSLKNPEPFGGATSPPFSQPGYDGKKVHLAYASAVPVGVYGNDRSVSTVAVANIIMEAQYTAALKAAKDLGVQELFLMPLGGGAFQNQRSDISRNLQNALSKVDMSGCDVILLTYGPNSPETNEFENLLNPQ
jgi:hypothetical protein